MEENEKNLNTEDVSELVEEVVFSEGDINENISPEEVKSDDIENNTEISADESFEVAEEEIAPEEEVAVESDDFSFFLSVLDESSDDYGWVMNQLSHTVPVNDMVEEYDEAMKLREEAEAAAEKARLEAEEKERARIEEEKRLEEARLKAEEEARLRAEEEARLREEEETRRKEEEARQKEEAERIRLEEAIKAKAAEEAKKARELAEEEARIKAAEEARLQEEAEKAQQEKEQAIINDGIEPEFEDEAEDNDEAQDEETEEIVDDDDMVFEVTDEVIDEEEFIVGRRRKKMDDRLAKLEASVEDNMQKAERPGTKDDYKARFDSIFGSSAGNKNLKVFGIPKNVFGIIITVIFAIDMLFINSASYKIIYFLMEKLLVSNGVEALRLTESGFSNIFVGVSYVASFFIGGLVILIVSKLAEKIIQGVAFANGRAVTMAVVGAFTLIFLVGAALVAMTNGNLLSLEVYRWVGPLLTYLGGLLFLAISKVSLSIDY